MKVFFPVEVFFPSQAGGPANTVYWLAKNLSERGFEPIVVSTDKGLHGSVKLNKWTHMDAGRTIYVKTRFLHFPIGQTIMALANFLRADVIHLSSVFFPTAFITGLAARLFQKPLAWSPRGELSDYSLNYSGKRKRPILFMIRKLIGRYPLFHSTSEEETQDIRRVFGASARVVMIPNFVELEPALSREPGDYFLSIGRLHPKKAVDNLIRAVAGAEAFLKSNLQLWIAGKGKPEYEAKLRSLVTELGLEEKIRFLGQVEGAAKHQILANAKFTFMPSHSENFGIVVLESLAQGTPVVASHHTPWESLEKEKVGFSTGNSPEELTAAIERVLTLHDEEYEAFRKRGKEYVRREFDIRDNMDKWLDFYERLR
ncbi:MAG TPA: glycosyltransferase [Pyrinomonadaceae bacterium]|nr:glycosyltransferase [Pyrinomonadaceae bacterium]